MTGPAITKWSVLSKLPSKEVSSTTAATGQQHGMKQVCNCKCVRINDKDEIGDDDIEGNNRGEDMEESDEDVDGHDNDDDDDDENSVEEDSEGIPSEDVQYAAEIKVAGSHKEMRYQRKLEDVLDLLRIQNRSIQDIKVRLEPQPTNPKDVNAITVIVDEEEIGTIPKRKIIKVTNAIRNNAISDCKLLRAPYAEVTHDGVQYMCLSCHIVLIKRGRWGHDARNYSYNDRI